MLHVNSLPHIMFTEKNRRIEDNFTKKTYFAKSITKHFFPMHSSSMALQDKSKKPVEIIRLMSGLQSATTEEMKENQSVIQYIFSLQ